MPKRKKKPKRSKLSEVAEELSKEYADVKEDPLEWFLRNRR